MHDKDQLAPGAVVASRYRVLRALARGGYGAVYVAEHVTTEKQVALKVLWPHVLEDQRAIEKFMLEARIAGRLSSENIVQVLDAGVDDRTRAPFLVMELLQGKSLQKLVEEEGPAPAVLAVEYLRQVALGLDKAHTYVDREGKPAPIIHRDLKPDNLFRTQHDDGSPLIKILDFGIAKVLSQSMHTSGDLRGTPLYMAFEQVSRGATSPATDIWALGLVAFFLLTGQCFWRASRDPVGSLPRLFGEILTLPLPTPHDRLEELGRPVELPPAFDVWFTRCVNRNPSMRFTSASEAVRQLAAVLQTDGTVLPSIKSGPPVEASDEPRFLLTGTKTWTQTQKHTPIVDRIERPSRSPRRRWVGVSLGAAGVVGAVATLMARRDAAPRISEPSAATKSLDGMESPGATSAHVSTPDAEVVLHSFEGSRSMLAPPNERAALPDAGLSAPSAPGPKAPIRRPSRPVEPSRVDPAKGPAQADPYEER